MKKNIILIVFALLLLGGCKKDKDVHVVKVQAETPDVTTTANTADISGTYSYASTLKSVVIVYGKDASLSSPQKATAEHTWDSYSVTINNLDPGTTYYYYCIFDTGYGASESEQESFTTQSGGGGDHEYVDLGLPRGTLWATCNVGADNPEDYGDYYAWGETEPKSTYNWSTYKWCNGNARTFTKYNTDSNYGVVDNKTVLDPEDDAAYVNWGSGWRMPIEAELQELMDNCTWTWITQNGKNGYRVTGPNGSSIFLPAAGYYNNGGLNYTGSEGGYWSGSLCTDYPYYASGFRFNSGSVNMDMNDRRYGRPIRPVVYSTYAPIVTTSYVSNITQTTATCGGSVTSDGGATVTARGVCWSTSPNPTVSNSHTTDGSGTGSFTSSITGLTANTIYYVRAYATNSKGTSYGEQMSFNTPSGTNAGHAYVDLGLPSGLLWATCNIGANSHEDNGWYFMWGSVTSGGDPDCIWANCPGNGGSSNYNSSTLATWDATHLTNDVLNPNVDVASVAWGSDWRMPTRAEWQELYDNTTCTCTTENGKYGCKFANKTDAAKYIFLPAAGSREGTSLSGAGSVGYYWSSSFSSGYSDPILAQHISFYSGNVYPICASSRCRGFSVRPVR